ncbi:VOC family protein [Flavihumibacter solisilvae]|uniref:Glyoxalase/Bleomycin resistance-like N-terminal domain-containing protein n=1 Tax=Flavihumibacter solisilvae TaxID=1349421 RepID=A0A0C1IQD2_9BACT|nr:VOC family protein [Flavihumibacter solisilvae]KIC96420.1 hypothetical protein OI18_01395 [Flavihumibacter solisilvae]
MAQQHAVSWFEIPTSDIDRAQKFYESIFGIEMVPMNFPNLQMRMFPVQDPMSGVSGALSYAPDFYEPASNGTMVYLNANPDVQVVLDKVEGAGGRVLVPKTEVSPEIGFMGVFIDTEGNRVALHSIPQK